jgi:hypothetical protein
VNIGPASRGIARFRQYNTEYISTNAKRNFHPEKNPLNFFI